MASQVENIEKYRLVIDEMFVNGFKVIPAVRLVYNDPDMTEVNGYQRWARIKKACGEYINQKHEFARMKYQDQHKKVLMYLQTMLDTDLTEGIGLTAEEWREVVPEEIRKMVTGWKKITTTHPQTGETTTLEFRFINKEKVLEMINKHIGFYDVDNNKEILNNPLVDSGENKNILIVTHDRKP